MQSSMPICGTGLGKKTAKGIKITEKILYFKLFILLLFSDVECEEFMLDTFYKWTNNSLA